MFKNIANLSSMLRQAQEMGGQMQEITEKLRHQQVTAQAGGGMVEVQANGVGEILKVRIDPSLVDREMLEDLLPAAINQAIAKSKELHMDAMKSMTEGLEIPGLNEAMEKMAGFNPKDDTSR